MSLLGVEGGWVLYEGFGGLDNNLDYILCGEQLWPPPFFSGCGGNQSLPRHVRRCRTPDTRLNLRCEMEFWHQRRAGEMSPGRGSEVVDGGRVWNNTKNQTELYSSGPHPLSHLSPVSPLLFSLCDSFLGLPRSLHKGTPNANTSSFSYPHKLIPTWTERRQGATEALWAGCWRDRILWAFSRGAALQYRGGGEWAPLLLSGAQIENITAPIQRPQTQRMVFISNLQPPLRLEERPPGVRGDVASGEGQCGCSLRTSALIKSSPRMPRIWVTSATASPRRTPPPLSLGATHRQSFFFFFS